MSTTKRVKVETYLVTLLCECGGDMKRTGMMLASNPAQWVHKCVRCDKHESLLECYPITQYEYVKEP